MQKNYTKVNLVHEMINLGQGKMGPVFTESSAKYKSKTGNSIKYYNIYIYIYSNEHKIGN